MKVKKYEEKPETGKPESRNQSVFFLKDKNMYSWILKYV